MSSFLDSLKDIVNVVQSGVDDVNKLKSEGVKLVTDYTNTTTEMVDKVKDVVKIDLHDKSTDSTKEANGQSADKQTE